MDFLTSWTLLSRYEEIASGEQIWYIEIEESWRLSTENRDRDAG